MIFKSKRDSHFTTLTIKISVNMTLFLILPFIVKASLRTPLIITIWSSIYLVLILTVIMMAVKIRYEFHDEHLLIKGGPLRRKIAYSKIRFVAATDDVYDGFRVIGASHGVEIVYGKGWFGSVKVSPEDQLTFIRLLKYYSPQAEVEIDLLNI